MAEVYGLSPLPSSTLGKVHVKTGPGQQQLFDAGPGRGFHPLPFFDRNQHRRLNAAPRYYLRALRQGSVKELAESGFGILQLPGTHTQGPRYKFITGQMTSQSIDSLPAFLRRAPAW